MPLSITLNLVYNPQLSKRIFELVLYFNLNHTNLMTPKPKDIAIISVFILFTIPTIFGALNFAYNPSDEKLAQVVEDVAVPWWVNIMVGIVNTFENHPYALIISIVVLVLFLRWIGEKK